MSPIDHPPAHHQRQGRPYAGKGSGLRHGSPLLARFVEAVNGDGESLRQSCSTKLAHDKSLFGNAFLEVVTDARRSVLSLYHQDASRCRLADGPMRCTRLGGLPHRRGPHAAASPSFEEQADGTLTTV